MNKRILLAIPCLLTGGTEIQTLYLAKALMDLGYEVHLVCYFEFSNAMINEYKNIGVEVYLLSPQFLTRPKGVSLILFLYEGLKKIVKSVNPVIVHTQYMAPGAIPLVIFKSMGIKRLITTNHTQAEAYGKNVWLPRLIAKYVTKSFICVSKASERSFFGEVNMLSHQTNLKGNRHFTLYNCLGFNFNVNNELPKVKTSKIVRIGVVSRLEKIKGIDILLKAIAITSLNHKNIEIRIAGAGGEEAELKELAKSLDIDSLIQWHGRLNQNELPGFYSSNNIMIVPSRMEGFGLTAVEAMAFRLPVIASNVGGLPEIIQPGYNGLLFESENHFDLNSKISLLLDDLRIRNQMGRNAIDTATKFSFENYKVSIDILYSKVTCTHT